MGIKAINIVNCRANKVVVLMRLRVVLMEGWLLDLGFHSGY